MFPFHRLSEEGREAFTWANEEAVQRGARVISTEHLLLALLRTEKSLAARALSTLGISGDAVRRALGDPEGPPTRPTTAALAPDEPLRQTIERAFDDATRRGEQYVSTEHLLLGLLAAGGRAADVLAQLGATATNVIAELDRLRPAASERSPDRPEDEPASVGPELGALLREARELAEAEAAPWVRPDHLLRAMVASDTWAGVVAAIGVDLPAARALLTPTPELAASQRVAREMRGQQEAAAKYQDYERAAALRDRELAALTDYQRSLNVWLSSIGRRPG